MIGFGTGRLLFVKAVSQPAQLELTFAGIREHAVA